MQINSVYLHYSGTYALRQEKQSVDIVSGNLTKVSDGFEVTVPTGALALGGVPYFCICDLPGWFYRLYK